MKSFLVRKAQRRTFKFLKYALVSGRPLLVVGSPSFVSSSLFKNLVVKSGNCFSRSLYFAKTLNLKTQKSKNAGFLLTPPAAVIILGSVNFKESYFEFLRYVREQRIPVLNFTKTFSSYHDYSYVLNLPATKSNEIFLSWVICQTLKLRTS